MRSGSFIGRNNGSNRGYFDSIFIQNGGQVRIGSVGLREGKFRLKGKMFIYRFQGDMRKQTSEKRLWISEFIGEYSDYRDGVNVSKRNDQEDHTQQERKNKIGARGRNGPPRIQSLESH